MKNNRGQLRNQGRGNPPYVMFGLLLLIAILLFNFWSKSSRVSELNDDIAVLRNQLDRYKLQMVQSSDAQQRNDNLGKKLNEQANRFQQLEEELKSKNIEINELKGQQLSNVHSTNDNKKALIKCRENITQLAQSFEEIRVSYDQLLTRHRHLSSLCSNESKDTTKPVDMQSNTDNCKHQLEDTRRECETRCRTEKRQTLNAQLDTIIEMIKSKLGAEAIHSLNLGSLAATSTREADKRRERDPNKSSLFTEAQISKTSRPVKSENKFTMKDGGGSINRFVSAQNRNHSTVSQKLLNSSVSTYLLKPVAKPTNGFEAVNNVEIDFDPAHKHTTVPGLFSNSNPRNVSDSVFKRLVSKGVTSAYVGPDSVKNNREKSRDHLAINSGDNSEVQRSRLGTKDTFSTTIQPKNQKTNLFDVVAAAKSKIDTMKRKSQSEDQLHGNVLAAPDLKLNASAVSLKFTKSDTNFSRSIPSVGYNAKPAIKLEQVDKAGPTFKRHDTVTFKPSRIDLDNNKRENNKRLGVDEKARLDDDFHDIGHERLDEDIEFDNEQIKIGRNDAAKLTAGKPGVEDLSQGDNGRPMPQKLSGSNYRIAPRRSQNFGGFDDSPANLNEHQDRRPDNDM